MLSPVIPTPTAKLTYDLYQVTWLKANALQPETYAHLLPAQTAVVHTLGTLLEDARYKAALKDGDLPKLLGTFASGLFGAGANPLAKTKKEDGYEVLNHDAGAFATKAMQAGQMTDDACRLVQPCVCAKHS